MSKHECVILNAVADGINGFDFDYHGFGGNDGNYPQGTISALFGDGTMVFIEDTSCGDFGMRILVKVITRTGSVYAANFGTMLPEEQCYSEIWEDYAGYANAIRDAFGYNIPLRCE